MLEHHWFQPAVTAVENLKKLLQHMSRPASVLMSLLLLLRRPEAPALTRKAFCL